MKQTILTIITIILFYNVNYAESVFITCPDSVTIHYCQDYEDLDLTGTPEDLNTCFSSYTYSDSVVIDQCHRGEVWRTWTGHGLLGEASCVQYIALERNNYFEGSISWPKDWQGHCGDEIPFDEPLYDPGFCDMIAHNYKDDTFHFTDNACTKILRTWTVIDWCVYEANQDDNDGMWKHVQILNIVDDTPPEIQECGTQTIYATNSNCSADFTLTKKATEIGCNPNSEINWKYEFDRYNDGTIDSTGIVNNKNEINLDFQNVETGEHSITWTAYDGCGNVSTCKEVINVVDGKKPTLICYLSTAENLIQGDDSLRLPAKHFVKFASDNCTDKENITFSFTSDPRDSFKTFTCWDLGFQFLQIFAFDEAGNSDYVFIFTRIMINGPCNYYPTVNGIVSNFANKPLKGVQVGVNAHNSYHPVDMTGDQGEFDFVFKEYPGDTALLQFDVDSSAFNSINKEDLKILRDYLLGRVNLDDKSLYAADMNNDGIISVKDILLLRDVVYGKNSGYVQDAKFYMYQNDTQDYMQIDKIDIPENSVNVKCLLKGDVKYWSDIKNKSIEQKLLKH